MWYLYILLCDKEYYYTGITFDLDRRIRQHKEGSSFFTKRYKEIKLVYWEKHFSKHEAALREKEVKGWRKEKKEALIRTKSTIS